MGMEVMVEVGEIVQSFQLNDELWIIMCYTALMCITMIDLQYFEVIKNDFKRKMVKADCKLKIETKLNVDLELLYKKKGGLTNFQKFCYCFTILFTFLYETVYFY